MKNWNISLLVILSGLFIHPLSARAESEQVYSKLPVKEVTIFKDGHTFVLHEGSMKTNEKGNVVLDQLPSPIMGAFWAYSAQDDVELSCVISSRDEKETQKTAASLTDLIKANLHKQALIKEISQQQHYQAEIMRLLNDKLVMLKLPEGIKAIPVEHVQNITFLEDPSDSITQKVTKETLTFVLKHNGQSSDSVNVGMAYIQRGIRWIPTYRVEIDGKGKAVLKLQATIINELADLDDVTSHLVIGVPRFTFQETPDPISFQEAVAQLSQHFRGDSSTAYAFSNAIMSQSARYREQRSVSSPVGYEMNLGPELEGSSKAEDLFVFTVEHISLKKGQRMVMPIAEFELPYEDVYVVDIPFAPPLEMRRNFNSNQHLELAKLFHAPNAIHKIRLDNTSEYPLTTAPATVFKEGRVLAQGMMTYTAVGNKGDLELTTAVNIGVKKSDEQTNIIPNAVNWNGNHYSKIEMQGTVELTNFSDKAVRIEVHRSVLGNMDEAAQDGTVKQLGHGYDGFAFESGIPFWWNWCSWPWWWYRFNSIGQADWKVELEPKENITLEYKWHYFWD